MMRMVRIAIFKIAFEMNLVPSPQILFSKLRTSLSADPNGLVLEPPPSQTENLPTTKNTASPNPVGKPPRTNCEVMGEVLIAS